MGEARAGSLKLATYFITETQATTETTNKNHSMTFLLKINQQIHIRINRLSRQGVSG